MKLAAALGAFLVAASVASAAPAQRGQYRNPTVGRDQIPGMHRAKVRRGFLYRRVGGERLRLDVYYPRRVSPSQRVPAVLLGGPAFSAGRQSGQKVGWAHTHQAGIHAFDVLQPGVRSRALIRRALAFMKGRLDARTFAAARRPPPLRLRQRCVTRAERRRVVRFAAIDRVRLIGVLLGSGPRAVVLAHQGGDGGEDLCVWMPYARALARAGYRVLAFDHRGHGSSGQASSVSRFTRVDHDVLGALRLVRARGAREIVLAGGSLGGAAVIAAGAAAQPPVQGVISFASPTSFGRVDALAVARNLHVPALFLSADRDEGFPEAARALYDATPPGDKRIWVFPGTRHGAPVLRDPAVKAYVDGWIREHLPGA